MRANWPRPNRSFFRQRTVLSTAPVDRSNTATPGARQHAQQLRPPTDIRGRNKWPEDHYSRLPAADGPNMSLREYEPRVNLPTKSGDFSANVFTHERLIPSQSAPHLRGLFCSEHSPHSTHDAPTCHSCLNLLHKAPTNRGLQRKRRRGLGPQQDHCYKKHNEHAFRSHR